MGCTESVPEASDYRIVHKADPKIPPLDKVGGYASNKLELIVKEKIFSFSGDTFKIKTLQGNLFRNGIQIQGKAFALRDQMALLDGKGDLIAVCYRKFELFGQTFKIYTPDPFFTGQAKSDRTYNGQPLYTVASVKREPMSTTQFVYYAAPNDCNNTGPPTYTIHRAGGMWPKKRVVRKSGQTAAFMEGGSWGSVGNSYLLVINEGIDPCLILCLAAICDEMDEDS
jgi:hypothetical protein